MDTQWPRRGFALLVLFLLFGVALGVPAMASTGGDMEEVLDQYQQRSEDKLDWLEDQLEVAKTQAQRRQAFDHAKAKLAVYADQAIAELIQIAGSDPELMQLATELIQEINALEQDYLAEAAAIFQEASETTTTTVPPTSSTTSTTTPAQSTTTTSTTIAEPSTTTTVPKDVTTTTSTSTTSTTIARAPTTPPRPPTPSTSTPSTTSTTVAPPSQPTSPPPPPPPAVPAEPPTADPASTPGDFAGDFSDAPLDPDSDGVFGQLGSELAAEGTLVDGIEGTDALPMTGLLAKYVPAGLPSTFATPTVGFLAIFEMVAGAFIASFKQLGGPAAAASTYLGYSVWRYLVTRF